MQAAHAIDTSDLQPIVIAEPAAELKVVLVYEDFDMAVQGKHVFDLITKETGGEESARLTLWRFDFFHSTELTIAVGHQAEEADIIIVAPRNPNYLPPQVKAWLERWPQRRKQGSGALVAVFHPSVGGHAKSSDAALLLWRAAGRAGMDFFCRTAQHSPSIQVTDTSRPDTGRTTSHYLDEPITTTQTTPLSYREWGVNE